MVQSNAWNGLGKRNFVNNLGACGLWYAWGSLMALVQDSSVNSVRSQTLQA